METANNVQQASGKAVVLDTTGTGIPTVETHDTDAPGAKDGPLARITPEADEQVDGKGRTLVEIDAELNRLCDWLGTFHSRICEHDDHLAKINRLIAARVPKPCEPSKATGENELATAVQAADWREALVVEAYPDPSATRWLCTPDRKWYWNVYEWFTTSSARDRDLVDDNAYTATARRTCTEPPNLREWWPVKAEAQTAWCAVCGPSTNGKTFESPAGGWFCERHALDSRRIMDSIPTKFHIPGVTVDGCVSELAKAYAAVSSERDELRRQLARAQTDLVSMTAQRDNAVRRATAAETALADLRARIERDATTP